MSTTPFDDPMLRREPRLNRPAPPPPRRRRFRLWAWLVPAAIGAAIAGLAVSGYYETATLGQRVDATVERGQDGLRALAGDVQQSADRVVENGAQKVARAASVLTDAGITASIKTALAADPALSAMKIEVRTQRGVVTLAGPAPDEQSRERATVLARAPQGVLEVRNELALPGQAVASTPLR